MTQELVQAVVAMLTRRTYATTEGWSPIVGLGLTWLALALHIGSGTGALIAAGTPALAGFIVAWVAVARKSAAAKWLHGHIEPSLATAIGPPPVSPAPPLTPPSVSTPVPPAADPLTPGSGAIPTPPNATAGGIGFRP